MMSSEEKSSEDGVPAVVIEQLETKPRRSSHKNRIIIVATVVVVVSLVLAAILVGMYLFTEAEKDILQISLQLKNNMTQEISSNPSTNTVLFHMKGADQETWIVNDYNADLKVVKIQTHTETNCFVTPLNESSPMDLPKIKSADAQFQTNAVGQTVSLSYTTSGSPIKDNSFLSKTAGDMCSGVSTYWWYPQCDSSAKDNEPNKTSPSNERQDRGVPYYAEDPCTGNYYYESNCPFFYAFTYYSNYYLCSMTAGSLSCCIFQWAFLSTNPGYCLMYKCSYYRYDYWNCPVAKF